MSLTDPEFDDWVQRARQADVLATAERLGATLKRSGSGEHVGACPACGGTDRFQVKPKDGVFLCRGSGCGKNGSDGGDIITMAMHILACDFVAACESINGELPPRSQGSEPRPFDDSAQRARKDQNRDRRIVEEAEEESDYEKDCRQSQKLFDAAEPIEGTHAWRYLVDVRGLRPSPSRVTDLRFMPSLTYRWYAHPDDEETSILGAFPCMLAAIRDRSHRIIGIHRTYLDPAKPIKAKLPERNNAKKVFGNMWGGVIWLGPVCASVAIAEGIETALAWEALSTSDSDFTVCASVAMGNLAGKCTGNIPHPGAAGRTLINAIPDFAEPAIVWPADVLDITILGDGDSDACLARQSVLAGARRFRAQGKTVSIAMAPAGKDWNDVLLDQIKEGQAA